MVNNVIPAASITIRKGEGDQDHNIRKFISANVDKERIKDNIVFVNESLKEAYRTCFDDGIREYNLGKKPSRQKWGRMEHPADGYLQKLEQDIAKTTDKKKRDKLPKPFYEIIVQIGAMADYGIFTHPECALIAKEILIEYMYEFIKTNSRLHVFCAVLHLDEGVRNGINLGGTPHLHINYFPQAIGLKRGLPIRNSLTQALYQQGITSGNNKQDNNNNVWQRQQIDIIKKICDAHGVKTEVMGSEKRGNLTPDQCRFAITFVEQMLDRARQELDKSIKHHAFNKVIVDVKKLKEERTATDVLKKLYHDSLLEVKQIKEKLLKHYKDSELVLRTEMEKAIRNLNTARKRVEDIDRKRQGEALMAQAELKIKEAEIMVENAYKSALAEVYKDTECKINEAEYRGRQLGTMDMQNRVADAQSRAISAEKERDKALKEKEYFEKENSRLNTEIVVEREKAQRATERYINLINTVQNNFSKVSKTDKVRLNCQQYFKDSELYEIVKWSPEKEKNSRDNNLQY